MFFGRMKYILLVFSFLVSSFLAFSSNDSIFNSWNDAVIKDTNYLKEIDDLIWNDYLSSNPDSALILCDVFEKVSERAGNKKYMFTANNMKGIAWYYLQEFDSAIFYYEKAINVALKSNNIKRVSATYHNIAVLYSLQKKTKEAINCYKKSIEIELTINYQKGLAVSYNGLSILLQEIGRIEEALDYSYKALKLYESLNDKEGLAESYTRLGTFYFQIEEDYKKSLFYYKKSKELRLDTLDYRRLGHSYRDIGDCYTYLNKYDSAAFMYDSSMYYHQMMNDTYGKSLTLTNQGYLHEVTGDLRKSVQFYREALSLVEINDSPLSYASLHNNLASMFLMLNQRDSAELYAKIALKVAEEISNIQQIINSSSILMETFEKKGDFKNAFKMSALNAKMKDSIFNEKTILNNSRKHAKYEYEKKALADSLAQQKVLASKNAEIITQKAKNRTNIILVSSALGILILLGVFYYWLQKNKNEKQVMVLKNQALRLQINPHFFFNALNSINKYIGNNEPIQAKSYLSKFAKVMRLSLESVQEDVVSLEQEIEFLINYLEIEKLQHKNFEYEISVDPNIDAAEIAIPPIIIQPYVENSILHGFINKTEDNKGCLKVSFTKEGKNLRIIISDDGVGVEQTIKTKSESSKHKSLALSITQKRLNAFSRKKVRVNISANQECGGTNIEFLTPIIAF